MSDKKINDTSVADKPLVTFALFAYSQERYIREAVEGALSQTYSPLQIILSDDCSPDRTFDIMKEMVAEYSGPHEIVLNRNLQNKGLACHINHVMGLAKGELIVVAAGDDISIPERTSDIVDFYITQGKPDSIFSDFHQIDENGVLGESYNDKPREQDIKEFINDPMIKGAAHAWSKRIFSVFGPLSDDVLCEDQVIPFRAYFLNQPRFLDKKLILYRRNNLTVSKYIFFDVHIKRKLSSRVQYLSDANIIKPSDDLIRAIDSEIVQLISIYEFWHTKHMECISSAIVMFRVIGISQSFRWAVRKLLCVFRNE